MARDFLPARPYEADRHSQVGDTIAAGGLPMNRSMAFALLLALSACASPASPGTSPDEVASLRQDLAQLQDSVDHLQNHLGHLQSNVDAASADNEFTELAIDAVSWSDDHGAPMVGSRMQSDDRSLLLCHPAEWRGWGKLMRFARLADPVLYLESEGHPSIEARMETGGICSSDGSLRFVFLDLNNAAEPGVAYQLRPRNQNEHYRWIVGDGVLVAAR
jgi:hypothetical protein